MQHFLLPLLGHGVLLEALLALVEDRLVNDLQLHVVVTSVC